MKIRTKLSILAAFGMLTILGVADYMNALSPEGSLDLRLLALVMLTPCIIPLIAGGFYDIFDVKVDVNERVETCAKIIFITSIINFFSIIICLRIAFEMFESVPVVNEIVSMSFVELLSFIWIFAISIILSIVMYAVIGRNLRVYKFYSHPKVIKILTLFIALAAAPFISVYMYHREYMVATVFWSQIAVYSCTVVIGLMIFASKDPDYANLMESSRKFLIIPTLVLGTISVFPVASKETIFYHTLVFVVYSAILYLPHFISATCIISIMKLIRNRDADIKESAIDKIIENARKGN